MAANEWFLLVIHLDKTDVIPDVIEILNDHGVTGCTLFESTGVGHTTFQTFTKPVIASMSRMFGPDKQYNKTMFTVIEGEDLVDKVMDQIEDLVGDFCTPDRGIMYCMPLRSVRGYRVMLEEGTEQCEI